ncbi:ELL2 factor, partial [Smithornis capensis]|nr:ELL2 factor [Smithornis capensis]
EVRRAPQSTADPVPERKRTTPLNPASITRRVFRGVSRRPFRDRVIHLLALRSYKKPELLAHLQRDGVKQKDRNCLGKTLQQVANLNVKDNSFSLKEHFYKDIQRDWPGYSETERQSLELILSRKAASTSNATCSSHLPSQGPSARDAPSRT